MQPVQLRPVCKAAGRGGRCPKNYIPNRGREDQEEAEEEKVALPKQNKEERSGKIQEPHQTSQSIKV